MGYRKRTLRAPTINDDLWAFIARDTPWPDRCFTQFVVTPLEVRAIWNEHREHILNYWVITDPGTRPHHWWLFDAPRLQLDVKSQEVVPSIQLEEADGSYAVSSDQEDRVDTHKNAPMTPGGRLRMVQAVVAGEAIAAVASRLAVDRKTVRKWVRRHAEAGAAGLLDRSSRPRRSPTAIRRGTAQRVITLRRRRYTMATIAQTLGIAKATVSRVLARAGLSRLAALDPVPLPQRYERATPGELLHLDIKRLGAIRGVGHRITGDRQRRSRGAGAGMSPMSPSMIIRGSALPRSGRPNGPTVPRASCSMP